MPRSLKSLIADGRAHVFDGAMGTMLYARGVFVNVCYDELNLKQPELIRAVHQDYVRAGAEIIETNTFGANPVKLSAFGLAERTEEINKTAAELARSAANGQVSVVGAIGPLGVRIEPFGPTSRDEAVACFRRRPRGSRTAAWTASCSRPSPTSMKRARRCRPCARCPACRSWCR